MLLGSSPNRRLTNEERPSPTTRDDCRSEPISALALQEKTGFPFERERVWVCVAVRESCGVACEPFAPTIAPVRGSRQ